MKYIELVMGKITFKILIPHNCRKGMEKHYAYNRLKRFLNHASNDDVTCLFDVPDEYKG